MTDEIMEGAKRHVLAMRNFDALLSALRAGGFDLSDSYDLRACMERGWHFPRVLEALKRQGKPLESEEALSNAQARYEAAMETLEPYYQDLVTALEPAGFDESWGGKSLRGCLRRGFSFERFLGAMDGWGRPLLLKDEDTAWAVEMSYLAVLTHGQTIVDLYAGMLESDDNATPPPGHQEQAREDRQMGW